MNEQKNVLTIKQIVKDYETFKHPAWDHNKHFSKQICLEAEKKHEEQKCELFNVWRNNISIFNSEKVFMECRELNGISKKEFLKRFLIYRPIQNTTNNDCFVFLNHLNNDLDPDLFSTKSFLQSTDIFDKLCSAFATMEWRNRSIDWLISNEKRFWKNISLCLSSKDELIVQETCIATAYLVYKVGDNISDSIITVFIKLVQIVADCSKEFDKYSVKFNADHETFILNRRGNKEFYFPPFKADNVDYMTLSSAFYCQAFILNYFFSDDLYDIFLSMINEMTEIGKYFQLDLLTLVVEKLEIMINGDPEKVELVQYIELIFEHTINFAIDKNSANKISIININSILRNILQKVSPAIASRIKRKSSYDVRLTISRRREKSTGYTVKESIKSEKSEKSQKSQKSN